MDFNPLSVEQKVIQKLKPHLRGQSILLGVSGGVDSMVMLQILLKWQRYLKISQITVAHVHHGLTDDLKQNHYRHRAQKLILDLCRASGVAVITNRAKKTDLHSEAELRSHRLRLFRRWLRIKKSSFLVLAHHQDDLLETRLLRLIRGTGIQGLKSMDLQRGRVLRPLLAVSREEVKNYAIARGLVWLDDPSNDKTQHLRNWLRHEWLPQLVKRSPGGKQALARSLEKLSAISFSQESPGPYVGLRRKALMTLVYENRCQLIANYLKSIGLRSYTENHVQEIAKRIDTQRKNLEFQLLGCVFRVTPDLLWAEPSLK